MSRNVWWGRKSFLQPVSLAKGNTKPNPPGLGGGGGKGRPNNAIAWNTAITPGWFAFTNSNLTVTASGAQSIHFGYTKATGNGVNAGKWYWEAVCLGTNPNDGDQGGVAMVTTPTQSAGYIGVNAVGMEKYVGYAWNGWTGKYDAGHAFTAFRSSYTTNDVIGVAVDIPNKKIWFSKNGTWQGGGDPAAGTSPTVTWTTGSQTWFPAIFIDEGSSGTRPSFTGRFTSGSFTQSIPSGFSAYQP